MSWSPGWVTIARILDEFGSLSADDWSGLMVPHPYMGPLPAMFYPMFQLVDYAVHTWDIRQGRDDPHALGGDAADLLVPVIYVLWGATADVSGVDEPYTVGIRTSGRNGGDMRAEVSSEGVGFEPGATSTDARRSSSSIRPRSSSRDTPGSTGTARATVDWLATSAACSSPSDRLARTIPAFVRRAVDEVPDKTWLVAEDGTFTYAAALDRIERARAGSGRPVWNQPTGWW